MGRRAGPSEAARCPWCEIDLPKAVGECPTCRFPLTMDGAGLRPLEGPGTASTASLTRPLAPRTHPGAPHRPVGEHLGRSRKAHRMRMASWLLGLMALLLLLSGLTTWSSLRGRTATGDREANADVYLAFQRAMDPSGRHHPEVVLVPLGADVSSAAPAQVSVDAAEGLWFGASQSPSGRCYVIAGRLDGHRTVGGTLAKEEPCTAAQAKARLGPELMKG